MINHLSGTLIEKTPSYAIIECGGIGFSLLIPISTYENLATVGSACSLLTYLQMSQDDIRLYGFATPGERELFAMLIGVSGVGPKTAISVLSTMSIAAFVKAVDKGEDGIISRVPGLGKKTAQRLIMELKDKTLKLIDHIDKKDYIVGDHRHHEVESALEALGFDTREIQRELSTLSSDAPDMSTEQMIKELIKRIYQKRK